MDPLMKYVYLALFSLTILLICVGNFCVVITMIKVKSVRTVQNYFVVSLAIADLILALLVVPAPMIMMYTVLPDFMCRTCHFSVLASEVASIYSLVLIAIDRYRCLVQTHSSKITTKTCLIMIASVWLISLLYGLRRPLTFESPSSNGRCGFKSYVLDANLPNVFKIMDFIFVFFIPLTVIGILYGVIIARLLTKKQFSSESEKKTMYVVYMLVLLVVLFLVCQGPIHILDVYYVAGGARLPMATDLGLRVLQFARSWLNVCMYAYWNRNMRQAFRSLLPISNKIKPTVTDASKSTVVATET